MSRRTQFRKTTPRRVKFDPQETLGCKCDECPLKSQPKVRPKAIHGAKLLILEDNPFKSEEYLGIYRRNSNHAFVEHCAQSASARDFDFAWTLLCRPDGLKDAELKKAIACCSPQLEKSAEQAKVVLAAGHLAFTAATGLEGSPQPWLGTPTDARQGVAIDGAVVIPTHTPWHVRSKAGSRLAGQFLAHVTRAAMLSDGRLSEFKWPEIITEYDQALASDIIETARLGREIGLDLETRSTMEISCLSLAVDNIAMCFQYPFSSEVRETIQYVLDNSILVTQNGPAFDHRVLRAHGFNVRSENYESWNDTLLAASILDPQLAKNLGALVSDEFHARAHKAEYKLDEETGRMVGEWDSRNPEVEYKRRIYCAKDAWTTLMLWKMQKRRLERYV